MKRLLTILLLAGFVAGCDRNYSIRKTMIIKEKIPEDCIILSLSGIDGIVKVTKDIVESPYIKRHERYHIRLSRDGRYGYQAFGIITVFPVENGQFELRISPTWFNWKPDKKTVSRTKALFDLCLNVMEEKCSGYLGGVSELQWEGLK